MVSSRRKGFSLVELIVVMGIIALLVALFLPAVQQARESARLTECRNHLKQIGTAVFLHEEAHGHYPTNGWGYLWVADPDAGYDENQPGGWIYNILPYVERTDLRTLGRGMEDGPKRDALADLLALPASVFNCPSRRPADTYPHTGTPSLRNVDAPERVAKSDYAVNGGDTRADTGPGPVSADPDAVAAYPWPDPEQFTGVSFVRSRIRVADVSDGTSNTLLVAEKFLSQAQYATGGNLGDDQSMYVGDDADIRRWTFSPPLPDSTQLGTRHFFGGPHAGGCQAVYGDGSVHNISFRIDAETFRALGNRHDQ